jgi:histidine ammonia-lyase
MMLLHNRNYSIQEIAQLIHTDESIELAPELIEQIKQGRRFLEDYVERSVRPIYGINTGFGSLCDTEIGKADLGKLQENLVRSHACGTGNLVPKEVVKFMMVLKVIGLSKGNSGVRLQTVQALLDLYNHGIIPVVYEQGSLGASGDLAPLAHISLALLGEGKVYYNDEIVDTHVALQLEGLGRINLEAKEGLALLNGTQFMSSYACFILANLENHLHLLDKIAALSLDAFQGRLDPFDPAVHALRPHKGQVESARIMLEILDGSEWATAEKAHVQDPYSFRCIPQVHGASRDAIEYAKGVVEVEINAVTDNPTLIPDEDKIISAGNFHGQPLALALDFLAIAMAELASISERRVYKLISGQRGLPAYLVANPGLNSGLMIAQYTAASIVSQNKQLCTPASVDTIDSSNGQEDHVSMGANAATKAHSVWKNLQTVNAIELLTASQAADFREGKTSPVLEQFRIAYREQVPFIEEDVYISPLIEKTISFLK